MNDASPAVKKPHRLTILLSVNAAAILVAGILIANALMGDGLEFRMVGERSDVVEDAIGELNLLDSVSDSEAEAVNYITGNDDYISTASHEFDSSAVKSGELWNETAITIYATPDVDICVGGNLSDLGPMYWQTSNTDVIEGFYDSSRTWLGYDSENCRYPIIRGAGTTTITAGTSAWGYRVGSNTNWLAVPISTGAAATIASSNSYSSSAQATKIYYGVASSSSQAAGTYTDTVVYTATVR